MVTSGAMLRQVAKSTPVAAWGRFFSASGRSSILRLFLAILTFFLIFKASLPLFEPDSFISYAAGGALLGAALAKTVAETGRRLHDANWGPWAGGAVPGALLWFLVDALYQTGPDTLSPTQWIAIATIALLLLWPGSRGANRWGERPTLLVPSIGPLQCRTVPLSIVSVLGCALLTCSILAISHGMRDHQQRIVDMLERERAKAPPDSSR